MAIIIVGLTISGFLLVLATSAVFLLLWSNSQHQGYRYFLMVIFLMAIWLVSELIIRVQIQDDLAQIPNWNIRLLEFGFSGTCIAAYLFATHITDSHNQTVRYAIWLGIVSLFIYQIIFIVLGIGVTLAQDTRDQLVYEFPRVNNSIYFIFIVSLLWITWRHRVKIPHQSILNSLLLIGLSFLLAILSPVLRTYALPPLAISIGLLGIAYSLVRYDVMMPFQERTKQMEVIRDVGVAITTNVHSRESLNIIATQAVNLVEADAGAIYLRHPTGLVLEAVYNIPDQFVGYSLIPYVGLTGQVVQTRTSQRMHHYHRQWQGAADMPLAFETFGSVIGVPLNFRDEVVGVLLVILGRDERFFNEYDLQLLEMIAPQIAVTITNNRLFRRELDLKAEVTTAKQQLEGLLISTNNPVLATDNRTRIIFANPAAEDIFKDDYPQLTGYALWDLVAKDLLPKPRHLLHDIRQANLHVYEINLNERDYLVHITRLQEDEGWVVVLNDVTQLKAVDRLKSQMVRMTSHDLKNPLFSTMTYLELLEDDGAELFNEDMQYYLSAIWKQLERMKRIINGILDLERIQSGAPPLATCNVHEILTTVTDGLVDQARTQNIQFKSEISDELSPVLGDSRQLEQVIMNLLDNALKYTPNGGEVCLRAYTKEGTVIIEVQDTGIGIPREVQNQVFDRFFRVESIDTASISGSGLGLSLVKAIIDYHKGRVWLHSEMGKGTIFYVALPIAPKSASLTTN